MNRLAFSTLPCRGRSLDEMIALGTRYGFSGIELREGADWSVSIEMTPQERTAALLKLQRAGIRVTNLGSGVRYTGHEEDDRQFEAFREAAALACDLGAAGIRIFLGHFNARRDRPVPDIRYDELVLRIRQSCDEAAARGLQVWIETHNEFATGRVLSDLLRKVDRPNCAVIYDILHPLEEGETPETTIAMLGSRCAHVHIKDGIPKPDPMAIDWEYTLVGQGSAPIASIVRQLEQAGYRGCYSLEWETPWRSELQRPGFEPEDVFPEYTTFMSTINRNLMK